MDTEDEIFLVKYRSIFSDAAADVPIGSST